MHLFIHCVLLVTYNVQPHPLHYSNEAMDIIYFNGSTIDFTCDVVCEHECETLIYYNKSFLLTHNNLFNVPLDIYKLSGVKYPEKLALKIVNATAKSIGSYLCVTEAWNGIYIINKEINFKMAGMCVCMHVHCTNSSKLLKTHSIHCHTAEAGVSVI